MRTTLLISVGMVLGACAAALGAVPNPAPAASASSPASPEEAMRNYRRGRFEQSEEQYSALASERPEDARLRFNAGAAAYRRNDLTNAARWFESVVSAPDLKLQQQAYYNLGNTRYRLGEGATDPKGRQRLWQEALTNFTAASKLDASDAQAAGNLAFLRQKLKELEEQTPPPPQQQSQDSDNSDPQNPQDQKQNQQKDSSPSQDSKQDSSQGGDNSQPSPSQDPSDPKGQSQPSSDNPSGQQGEQKSDPGDSKGAESGKEGSGEPRNEGKPEEGGAESQAGRDGAAGQANSEGGADAASALEKKPGEMTRSQAIQVLEGQKGDEKALMLRSYGGNQQSERASRVRKPW
ncbi:MAG: tetratricopeptide repeat protein [Verrucomicrobiae bacterium]|nr:tetratricopeptide repeat protein [Verrucomicrobiae bacterium]